MAKRPVSYLQTDPRWKNIPYAVKGESSTIGGSGCGPTSMAMILATWCEPNVTPATECAWALKNGFKALNRGTFYAYFVPAAKRYGLKCSQLNGASLYGNDASSMHRYVRDVTEKGHLVIACMGPGNWTRSGHFVVVYKVADKDNIIYINDPASTRSNRVRGDWSLFKKQVKYYWLIEKPAHIEEEEDVTEAQVKKLIQSAIDKLPSPVVYNTLEEVPEWGYSTVEKLMAKGTLEGTGTGLSLSFDMLRLLVVLDRTGALD